MWNKDVSRILSLTDFGVSNTPLVGEGPHASLIRDVHTFLDQRVSFFNPLNLFCLVLIYLSVKCLRSFFFLFSCFDDFQLYRIEYQKFLTNQIVFKIVIRISTGLCKFWGSFWKGKSRKYH